MDSTQIASNILMMSRLQLLVEAIHRLHRLLREADRLHYAELLAPYVGETAGHYVYRVKAGPPTASNYSRWRKRCMRYCKAWRPPTAGNRLSSGPAAL